MVLECNRYIAAEEGVEYTIEIKLLEGFDFGDYPAAQARLCIPGHELSIASLNFYKSETPENLLSGGICLTDGCADLVGELKETDFNDGGTITGSKFSFRGLSIDERLAKETNIMGVNVEDVGYFQVSPSKVRWGREGISRAKYRKAVEAKKANLEHARLKECQTWDANQVDADSFKNEGLEFGIGLTGGLSQATPVFDEDTVCTGGNDFHFNFYYRSADFLYREHFVRYPAPLLSFSWNNLREFERKTVLGELQEINKEHAHRNREAKAGRFLPKPGENGKGKDYLPEWRHWGRMYAKEREAAFYALKKANASWEKGEDPNNPDVNINSGTIILDDSDEEDKEPIIKRGQASIQVAEDLIMVVEPPEVEVKNEVKCELAYEYIDIDAPPAKRPRITNWNKKTSDSVNGRSDDEQLERDREKAKELTEEIETEMRLAKLLRQKRDLKEKIEAAEKKMSGKK